MTLRETICPKVTHVLISPSFSLKMNERLHQRLLLSLSSVKFTCLAHISGISCITATCIRSSCVYTSCTIPTVMCTRWALIDFWNNNSAICYKYFVLMCMTLNINQSNVKPFTTFYKDLHSWQIICISFWSRHYLTRELWHKYQSTVKPKYILV